MTCLAADAVTEKILKTKKINNKGDLAMMRGLFS